MKLALVFLLGLRTLLVEDKQNMKEYEVLELKADYSRPFYQYIIPFPWTTKKLIVNFKIILKAGWRVTDYKITEIESRLSKEQNKAMSKVYPRASDKMNYTDLKKRVAFEQKNSFAVFLNFPTTDYFSICSARCALSWVQSEITPCYW